MTNTVTSGDEVEFARRLERMIPHEMAGKRFYLAECPGPYSQQQGIALTSPLCDRVCEPQLRRDGVWTGRGFCIALPNPSAFWLLDEYHRWAVVLHEAAHFVDRLDGWASGDDPAVCEQLEGLDPFVDSADEHRLSGWPPHHNHGLRFTRAALHLHARAEHHGWECDLARMTVAGASYALSPTETYLAALGDEPGRRIKEPLSRILDSEPPIRFGTLWADDRERWDEIEQAAREIREALLEAEAAEVAGAEA